MYQKLWLDDVQFLRNGVQQTDRQTDGQTDEKWHIEAGAPPKNSGWRGGLRVGNVSKKERLDKKGMTKNRMGVCKHHWNWVKLLKNNQAPSDTVSFIISVPYHWNIYPIKLGS